MLPEGQGGRPGPMSWSWLPIGPLGGRRFALGGPSSQRPWETREVAGVRMTHCHHGCCWVLTGLKFTL